MVRRLRLFLASPLLLALLVGCGEEGSDPNAVAAAKCTLPLSQRLLLPEGDRVSLEGVRVEELPGGRRGVTGIALVRVEDGSEGTTRSHEFSCVVAPDAADKLRGLRLETLDVPGSLDAWATAAPEQVVRSYVDALSIGDLELARSLSTPAHARLVQGQTDSWYRNVVHIVDLTLQPTRPEGRDVFVPVTFTLQQRRAVSMPNGATTWGLQAQRGDGALAHH